MNTAKFIMELWNGVEHSMSKSKIHPNQTRPSHENEFDFQSRNHFFALSVSIALLLSSIMLGLGSLSLLPTAATISDNHSLVAPPTTFMAENRHTSSVAPAFTAPPTVKLDASWFAPPPDPPRMALTSQPSQYGITTPDLHNFAIEGSLDRSTFGLFPRLHSPTLLRSTLDDIFGDPSQKEAAKPQPIFDTYIRDNPDGTGRTIRCGSNFTGGARS